MKNIYALLQYRFVLLVLLSLSSFSLLAALFAEVYLGLEPCRLCIYQRWPFFITALLSLLGLLMQNHPKIVTGALSLSGGALFINSGIALYHSGVERHWWKSAVDGCAVPNLSGEPQTILENIMSAPTARCDEIPWADPLLGLSMANYNVALCLGLAALCALSIFYRKAIK
jgi:disulfide bond formation protein DsbB